MDGSYVLRPALLAFLLTFTGLCDGTDYFGREIGSFPSNSAHDVSGTVYAVNSTSLYVVDFSYDGSAPDAFFWVGDTNRPNSQGQIVPVDGNTLPLGTFSRVPVILSLPDGLQLSDIEYLSVYCRRFAANFGHVNIPSSISSNPPAATNIGPIVEAAHNFRASAVFVEDAKTFRIVDLYYDGRGPDAYFWVGTGGAPDADGEAIPDENGRSRENGEILRAYSGATITLTLPGDLTVFDIDYLGAWCISANQNFGHVSIPDDLNVPPNLQSLTSGMDDLENCESLHMNLQIRWRVEEGYLEAELNGRIDADGYMAFGVSGSNRRSKMIGADVVVASYDETSNAAKVEDYRINAKSLCSQSQGVCPDVASGAENNVEMVEGGSSRVDGITTVRYRRPLDTGDSSDKVINADEEMYFVWAMGKLNDEGQVTFHSSWTQGPLQLMLNRAAQDNCESTLGGADDDDDDDDEVTPWSVQELDYMDAPFTVHIGPSGGERGYSGITGSQSWGIALYVNKKLIPEITLMRNVTYNFTILTGEDGTNSAKYHPIYITDDRIGGYLDKTQEEREEVKVYAGLDEEGQPLGGAVGRYCEWKPREDVDFSVEYDTFDEFVDTLTLECDPEGPTGFLQWTPDEDTPDLVYYQCYAHNYLGWKIHIVGSSISARVCSWLLIVSILITSTMASLNNRLFC